MPRLFSYGTLQMEGVQLSTLGRRVADRPDELMGGELSSVPIRDPRVVARLGKTHHANVVFSGNANGRVAGTVLDVTDAELTTIDAYEAADAYTRVRGRLASNQDVWVYVYADELRDDRSGPLIARRAVAGDEPILRGLRLQALTDDPTAFGSTYERELARTTADWQRWLSPGATFLLERSGLAVGIVAARPHDGDPSMVDLMAMWVAPSARGSGGGDALVSELVAWARERKARTVRLLVVDGNARARRFYERNGFRLTGRQQIRERDGAIELEMARHVGAVST